MLLLLLLLLLLLRPVKYFTSKTVYLATCLCLLEENILVLPMSFCSTKGKNRPKHRYLHCFFSKCAENAICAMFFAKGLKCIVDTSVFLTFITAKNTCICSVLTRQNVNNNTMFGTTFSHFVVLNSKNDHFWLRFCHRPSGRKKVLIMDILFVTISAAKF